MKLRNVPIRDVFNVSARVVEGKIGRPLVAPRKIAARAIKPKRILVSFASGAGDAILAMPAVRELRRAFPLAEISLSGSQSNNHVLDYYQGELGFSRVFFDSSSSRVQRLATLSLEALRLRVEGCDLAISFDGSRSDWVFFLAGAKHRVSSMLSRTPRPSIAHHSVRADLNTHRAERQLEVLRSLGIPVSRDAATYFDIPSHEEAAAEKLFSTWGTNREPVLGLYITSGRFMAQRNWPKEQAAGFIEAATSRGFRIILFGERSASLLSKMTADASDKILFANGELSFGVVAALIKRCQIFVGVDGGLTHLAAAVRTPVLAMFGPTAGVVYGPQPEQGIFLEDRETRACAPCTFGVEDNWREKCIFDGKPQGSCMRIDPSRVMSAVEALL